MENHEEHGQEAEGSIRENIAEHGYFIALFHSDGYIPSMAFTIGLYETYQHPELIIFGLDVEVMGEILNGLAMDIKSQKKYVADQVVPEILEGYDVKFLKADIAYYTDYLGYARWYYKDSDNFPVLQVVWPDKIGNWPWETEFLEDLKRLQPLLDRATEFRFLESADLGVFTTKKVLDGQPILQIFHNDNGDWQFHGDDSPKEEDAAVVGMEELVKTDKTLNEVFFLNYGEVASRSYIGGEWTIETIEFRE